METGSLIQSVIFKNRFEIILAAGFTLFIIILSTGGASAATVHGTVYEWDSFKPLENVLIEVNSTPVQYYVAADATYAFNLSSGNYLITARYFEGDSLRYTTRESVIISEEGDYVLDILLFPDYKEELLDQANPGDFVQAFEEDEIAAEESSENSIYSLLHPVLLLLILLLFAGAYFLKKGKGNEKVTLKGPVNSAEGPENVETEASSPEEASGKMGQESSEEVEKGEAYLKEVPEIASKGPFSEEPISEELPHEEPISEEYILENSVLEDFISEDSVPVKTALKDPDAHLPEDLRELMGLIRTNGNRITQKELRKKSPYSESKVSLMLSDLEERGLIEKFKKGRGNIIRIPDIHIRPPK
ncbi:MAG: MarR family transcriptional regulator [Methanosarcinaceae archaeon]|nr:MarR family transcriptional regulator [Methanosarcinaceae archaeon]